MSPRSFPAALLVTVALAAPGRAENPRHLDAGGGGTQVLTLSQNWNDVEAAWFYDVPQGSKLIPYAWFLHLEQAGAAKPFRDADNIRQLGYLPRTPDARGNPDGLPIGFAKDDRHLGFTCAACHTNQINFGGKAWLIDGAPTLGDFEALLRRLVEALEATDADAAKFKRFAAGVLGANPDEAKVAKLRQDLRDIIAVRKAYNGRSLPAAGAPPFGPGRVDAFGAIVNEVTVTVAGVPGNVKPADAPVSYPFLWDTPQHDFVQWNGAAENRKATTSLLKKLAGTEHVGALGRNAGEVIGVFGTLDATTEGSLLELKGYDSSVNRDNLIAIEESLRKLWSPPWPAEFPPIDATAKAQGRTLFHEAKCHECHDPTFVRDAPNREVKAKLRSVGTDPRMADNFRTRRAKTGVLKGRYAELLSLPPRKFGDEAPAALLLRHVVQRAILRPDADVLAQVKAEGSKLGQIVGDLEAQVDYKVAGEAKTAVGKLLGRFAVGLAPDGQPDIEVAYKARPLNGIWATAPYLHNGSVPNLDELLKPADQRSQEKFKVGGREFDPVTVGFKPDGGTDFDPTLPGNKNIGHDFGRKANGEAFSAEERRQLIEYLKSL